MPTQGKQPCPTCGTLRFVHSSRPPGPVCVKCEVPAGNYRFQDVMALTGVTYRQVDYWCRTGLVKVHTAAPGTGYTRSFTHADTLRMMVVAALVAAGVTNKIASQQFASYGMHNQMTEIIYQNGPVTIFLDVDHLLNKLDAYTTQVRSSVDGL